MSWRKGGLIYAPDGNRAWARSHALLPTPYRIDANRLRVYFAALDEHNYGRIGFADLDPGNPARVIAVAADPVLDIGEAGAFDDSGVVPSCILKVEDRLYLYYIGFQRAERVPYMLFSGLATAGTEGTVFTRHSRVPVLDRTSEEPFSRGAPFVCWENGVFRMWYWSCTHWTAGPKGMHYNNVLRHATSADGIHWIPDPESCLDPRGGDEFALGRPCVLRDGALYKMWYSIRSHTEFYKIGYAESADGVRWERRDDQVGITKSELGWDAVMICYGTVCDLEGTRVMFYNGTRHGSTGFGYAVWEP